MATESGLYSADFTIDRNSPIATKKFDVEIENSPSAENLVLETIPKIGEISIGESVKISCRYENSDQHLKLPKSEVVINDQSYENFTIPNLQKPVEIDCKAENSMGTVSSKFYISPNSAPIAWFEFFYFMKSI